MRLNGIVFKLRMFFNNINELINRISLKVKNVESKIVKFQLSDKNKKMLEKLNIKPTIGINNLLRKLFKVIHGLRQENGALENERSDILSFAKENGANNRIIKLIEEFSKEFEDARNGLNECRAYLEKKGKENKLLKSEIRKLRKCSKSAL
ncbi:hypothetical protein THOM_1353 [Trachipleistophora hominis]|uniref:Uncharacterized protein n=1 Tax=Trachipleistophora hominis TaxID=72359 RepID=L7JXC9_TRAHO|nr:hypothetical protein THOM_1353 [Trachipleistophora hominis]